MYGGGAINSRLIAERSWSFSVPDPSEAAVKKANALCDIYLLASRLRMPELETDVVKQLDKYLSDTPEAITPKLVDYIYDKTPEISPLRKLFVKSLGPIIPPLVGCSDKRFPARVQTIPGICGRSGG